MRVRDDDRGASTQVGAIVLFGAVVLALAVWQAQVVPQQNEGVEYSHSQRVEGDLLEVRNTFVSATGGTDGRSVTVEMAPTYPDRALFVNPGPPSATVRTVGTADDRLNLSVVNATAVDPHAADYWNRTRNYSTGGLVYEPGYNVYTEAPTTAMEHGVLFRRTGGTDVVVAGQSLVDGRRLTLVTLSGTLSRTSADDVGLELDAVSSSTTAVPVTNDSGNVTLRFATRLQAAQWEQLLAAEFTDRGGHVVAVRSVRSLGDGYRLVAVELEPGVVYQLRMAAVTVGSGGVDDPGPAYVTEVVGNGTTVSAGGSQQVVVEVRDRFNNPVSGVTVTHTSPGPSNGSVTPASATTGEDGRATFTYEAPDRNATATFAVYYGSPTPANRSVTVVVDVAATGAGSSDAFTVDWADPSSDASNDGLAACDEETCTWDASTDPFLNLTASTTPTADGANISFATNDTGVGAVSPGTNQTVASGEAETTLVASGDGWVDVYGSGGGSGDVVAVKVENVQSSYALGSWDFEGGSLASAGWSNTDPDGQTDDAGVNTYTSSSGSSSMFVRGTTGRVTSPTLNTGGFDGVAVNYWVEKGADCGCPGSELPESGEDLVVEYLANNGSWVEIARYDPADYSAGDTIAESLSLSAPGASHDDFALRFGIESSDEGYDYWHVDDVEVSGET